MFWKKSKIEYTRGDVVKLKNGVKFPSLKIDISDWHGRVVEVEKRVVLLELDSPTLDAFHPTLLEQYRAKNEYPHLVTIPKKDIEKTEPRDNYEDVEIAQDRMAEQVDKESKEPAYRKLTRKWVRHFQRSKHYFSLNKSERENSDFVLETFSDYMKDYEGKRQRNGISDRPE